MLQLLTKYLFQYKTVSIPQVGTIQLLQNPAQLDVVGKIISPPAFRFEIKQKDEVPEHQINFLENFLNRTREDVLRDLKFFGDKLHENINGPGFEWKGLGLINRSTQTLSIALNTLQPVTAEKITRPDAEHHILVGDQEMTSVQMTERRTKPVILKKGTSPYVLAGWILLILSILLIAFFLYMGKFKVNAAGLKQNVLGYQHSIIPTTL